MTETQYRQALLEKLVEEAQETAQAADDDHILNFLALNRTVFRSIANLALFHKFPFNPS